MISLKPNEFLFEHKIENVQLKSGGKNSNTITDKMLNTIIDNFYIEPFQEHATVNLFEINDSDE